VRVSKLNRPESLLDAGTPGGEFFCEENSFVSAACILFASSRRNGAGLCEY
jgi:hypothetical protein